jgi:DnaJ-class molecular chaperone
MKYRKCPLCDGSGHGYLDMNGNDQKCHLCDGKGKISIKDD